MATVLVAYDSKRGSTAEIAAVIADKLREAGLPADCKPVSDVARLNRYDAVVLGSAVYAHHWRPAARRFLRHHAGQLAERPLWLFSSGPIGRVARQVPDCEIEPKWVAVKADALGARAHVVFPGRLPTAPRGPLERILVRFTPRLYRDRRDWPQVRHWAARIAETLVEADRPRAPGRR
jgi:menaquinone-dependent protoporphyrinogen oxidase